MSADGSHFPRFGEAAPRLVANGWDPLPVLYGQKKTVVRAWSSYRYTEAGAQEHKDWGTGILTKRTPAVDIDVRNESLAAQIDEAVVELIGAGPKRIGNAPKCARLYRLEGQPFKKISTVEFRLPGDAAKAKAHKVEILADGQQCVAYNLHEDTRKPYLWNGTGEPLTVPVSQLPVITRELAAEVIRRAEAIIRAFPGAMICGAEPKHAKSQEAVSKDLSAKNPAHLREALQYVRNADLDYDTWIEHGLALKGALGDDGLPDWVAFSAQSEKHNPTETQKKWEGFAPQSLGAGYLYQRAREGGWMNGRVATVQLRKGQLSEAAAEVCSVLREHMATLDIYSRGRTLVRITNIEADGFRGPDGVPKRVQALAMVPVSPTNLELAISGLVQFENLRITKTGKQTVVREHCPPKIAKAIHEGPEHWAGFPRVSRIVQTPVLLMGAEGARLVGQRGLTGTTFIDVDREIALPADLSREAAEAALARIEDWLAEFPFETDLDRSVAVAGMMTAALRGSITAAPMIVVSKPDYGAGATTLGKLFSIVATGQEPPVVAGGGTSDELEKRLAALLIQGVPVIVLDNLRDGVKLVSTLLAQVLSEPKVDIRQLGQSVTHTCDTRCLLVATGVNVEVAADLVRRTLPLRIDPQMERPESRVFRRPQLLRDVAAERHTILRDVYTVAAAYASQPERVRTVGLAGYDEWLQLVAEPLLWLGLADVVRATESSAARDPTRDALTQVLPLLWNEPELRRGFAVADILVGEDEEPLLEEGDEPGKHLPTRKALTKVLAAATEAREFKGVPQVNKIAVGRWFARVRGRVATCDVFDDAEYAEWGREVEAAQSARQAPPSPPKKNPARLRLVQLDRKKAGSAMWAVEPVV